MFKMNKKILLISDFAYPVKAGTERLVFGLAEYFTNELKIKTDILTPNWNNLKEKETIKGVTIYRFKTHSIHKTKPIQRIIDYIKTGKKLPKYDVYHGFYMVPPLIATIFLSKIKKSKSIITFFARDQLEKNLNNQIKKTILLKILNQANKIITYTWLLEKHFEKYFPNKKIITIQGWSETKFKKTTRTKKQKRILFVGRMNKSKGIYVLLNAFNKIKNKTKAKLVLVGPPYEEKKIKEKIKKMKLEKRIEFKGFITDKELNKEYNNCTIVCVPALHDDSFGLSLMEAVSIGKPVISTDSTGNPKKEKTKELIVKKNDSNDLAKMLLKILTNKKFYEAAKKNALKKAKLFNKKKIMKKYLKIYKSVFNEKK